MVNNVITYKSATFRNKSLQVMFESVNQKDKWGENLEPDVLGLVHAFASVDSSPMWTPWLNSPQPSNLALYSHNLYITTGVQQKANHPDGYTVMNEDYEIAVYVDAENILSETFKKHNWSISDYHYQWQEYNHRQSQITESNTKRQRTT